MSAAPPGSEARARSVGLNALIYAAGTALAKASKFLLIPVYTGFLLPAEVGAVFFLEAIVTLSSRLYSLSLGLAVRRFAGEFDSAADRVGYARSVALIGFAAGVVLCMASGALVSLQAAGWQLQVSPSLLLAALAIGLVRSVIYVPQQLLISQQRAGRHELLNASDLLISAIAITIAIGPLGLGVEGYMLAQAAAALLAVLLFGSVLRGGSGWSTRRLGESVRYALAGLPHFIFGWGLTFADRLVLERLVPLPELGIYVIGYQLASVLPVFSLALVNAYVARFFREAEEEGGRRRFARDLPVLAAGVLGLALGLAALAPELVPLMTVGSYGPAAQVMQIVCLGLAFHGIFQLLLLVLYFQKRTGLISAISGSALLLNIGLDVWLVPQFGIVAGAWATVAAYVFAAAATAAFAWRFDAVLLRQPLRAYAIPLLLAAAMLALTVGAAEFNRLTFVLRALALLLLAAITLLGLREPLLGLLRGLRQAAGARRVRPAR